MNKSKKLLFSIPLLLTSCQLLMMGAKAPENNKIGNEEFITLIEEIQKGGKKCDITPFQNKVNEDNVDSIYENEKNTYEHYEDHTLLSIAIKNNNHKVARYLTATGASPDIKNLNGTTPLMHAMQSGRKNIVKLLLSKPDINVNLQNDEKKTALIYAVEKAESNPLYKKKIKEDYEKIRMLLEKPDINVNLQDNTGKTPLIYAIQKDREDIAELLLKKPDININLQDNTGKTPLDIAIKKKRRGGGDKWQSITHTLLSKVSDPNQHTQHLAYKLFSQNKTIKEETIHLLDNKGFTFLCPDGQFENVLQEILRKEDVNPNKKALLIYLLESNKPDPRHYQQIIRYISRLEEKKAWEEILTAFCNAVFAKKEDNSKVLATISTDKEFILQNIISYILENKIPISWEEALKDIIASAKNDNNKYHTARLILSINIDVYESFHIPEKCLEEILDTLLENSRKNEKDLLTEVAYYTIVRTISPDKEKVKNLVRQLDLFNELTRIVDLIESNKATPQNDKLLSDCINSLVLSENRVSVGTLRHYLNNDNLPCSYDLISKIDSEKLRKHVLDLIIVMKYKEEIKQYIRSNPDKPLNNTIGESYEVTERGLLSELESKYRCHQEISMGSQWESTDDILKFIHKEEQKDQTWLHKIKECLSKEENTKKAINNALEKCHINGYYMKMAPYFDFSALTDQKEDSTYQEVLYYIEKAGMDEGEEVQEMITQDRLNSENINTQDSYSHTLLIEAVIHNKPRIVTALLSVNGIEVNIENMLGQTALDIAIKGGYTDIVNLLTNNGGQQGSNKPGPTHEIFFSPFLGMYGLFSFLARKVESLFKGLKSPSLFFRAFALSSSPSLEKRNLTPEEKKKEDLSYKVLEDLDNSNIESLKAYVNEDNINEQLINGSTILITAVEYRCLEAVQFLLTIPTIDVNIQHPYNHKTALDIAKSMETRPIITAIETFQNEHIISDEIMNAMISIEDNRIEALKELVNKENINHRSPDGYTLLMNGVQHTDHPVVDHLLTIPGIRLHDKHDGQTALDMALHLHGKDHPIYQAIETATAKDPHSASSQNKSKRPIKWDHWAKGCGGGALLLGAGYLSMGPRREAPSSLRRTRTLASVPAVTSVQLDDPSTLPLLITMLATGAILSLGYYLLQEGMIPAREKDLPPQKIGANSKKSPSREENPSTQPSEDKHSYLSWTLVGLTFLLCTFLYLLEQKSPPQVKKEVHPKA